MSVPPATPGSSSPPPPHAAPQISLPGVDHPLTTQVPSDVPRVTVDGVRVFVDNDAVATVSAILDAKLLMRIDGLFDALKARRESWKVTHPGAAFPGAIAFAFEGDTKALVVKSVFQTAAFAG